MTALGTPAEMTQSPDAYALAAYLAARYGADTVIAVGCGSAHEIMALGGVQKIGIDNGVQFEHCRQAFPDDTWIEADLETCHQIGLDGERIARSVVICADVIGRLKDSRSLLALLAGLAEKAFAVIVTAPISSLLPADATRPHKSAAQIREWSRDAFQTRLAASGLDPSFVGMTVSNDFERTIVLAVIDTCVPRDISQPPDNFRPLAIVASYNDDDIVLQTTRKLLGDGIDVHVLDNWSDDGTFEKLLRMADSSPGLHVERFPAQPPQYYEWAAILNEKARIASRHPGRWIIHQDSDEIRSSPRIGMSFRHGLWCADQSGFNAVDFTVLDFRPVDDGFCSSGDPEADLPWFEFGRRPGHFSQIKAWKQGDLTVELARSGGHEARFPGRRVFPYKFLLKHYPLRSPEQARRKVFVERRGRFSPQERAARWHIQYDHWQPEDEFIWDKDGLVAFDEHQVRRDYLVEMISGIGIVRR